jgi:predicted nuclease with TOPRIM domain
MDIQWPNPAQRVIYPSPFGIYCKPITKPVPLESYVTCKYDTYISELDTFNKEKTTLAAKLEKTIKDLDDAEATVKGWSRSSNAAREGLIKRLTAEVDVMKKKLTTLDENMESLTKNYQCIINLFSIHCSRVKGYDEYIAWRQESTL